MRAVHLAAREFHRLCCEVGRLIAQIGGFLARKSDGELGTKTIWHGLDKVLTAAETLRALREGLD
jgi:hypothetical protein